MSFVQVLFLLGAAAVVGPLIAHLLARPRYRRVPFTMLRFLQIGQIESQSRRRFRDLLILLFRCAIIVLIAMLFARPRLTEAPQDEQARPVYYLGLDNSMSMAYSDGSGSYFDKMLDSAVDHIRSADDRGLFNICALASGDWAESLTKESALAELKRLKIVPDKAKIGDFLTAVRKKRRSDQVSVFVLSDFTPNVLDEFLEIDEPVVVDNVDYEPIISPKPVNDAAVIDAHVSGTTNGKLLLNVTVINRGQVEQNRKLTARIAHEQSEPVDIKLSPNQRRTYPVLIDADEQLYPSGDFAFRTAAGAGPLVLPAELSLSDADGLTEDDSFYLAVSVPRHQSVSVLVAGSSDRESFLLRTAMNALSQMDSYDTVSVRQVAYRDITVSDLDWADVIVCSTITDRLGDIAPDLKGFAEAGGKVIFFLSDRFGSDPAQQLWKEDVLPALPQKCVRRLTYIQPRASSARPVGTDSAAEKSLFNYRIDKIVLTGYLECKQHPESICAWRLQNGLGFIYAKRIGNGTAIVVNTSIDDSLGALTKSSASVAFCRYLLGPAARIVEHSFACGERVILPASAMEIKFADQKQFWVETSQGQKSRATVANSSLVLPGVSSIGWIRTLTKPTRYAGINLPQDESDLTKPGPEQVARAMDRAFVPKTRQRSTATAVLSEKDYKPVWKAFAWIIIALLLIEPAIANRLKR